MSNSRQISQSLFWGAALIIVGLLFLFDQWGWLNIGDLWPLIIIGVGVYLIIKSRTETHPHRDHKSSFGDRAMTTDSQQINYSNTFGDIKVKINSKKFESGYIRTSFGTVKADLTDLDIESGERILHLETTFGEIEVLPPKNVAFSVEASNTAGDVKIFEEKRSGWRQEVTYKSDAYDSTDKKLKILASQVFGDMKIL